MNILEKKVYAMFNNVKVMIFFLRITNALFRISCFTKWYKQSTYNIKSFLNPKAIREIIHTSFRTLGGSSPLRVVDKIWLTHLLGLF